MLSQQLAHSQVIGVVRLQVAITIDKGIDRVDGRRRRIDFVDQGHAGFLVRHRHPAAANTQGADPCHRRRQVIGAHGLVVEVQAQLLVQVVVEPYPEGAGAAGQGDAQHGVSAGSCRHNLLLCHN
ncbi:hypothetical protein D3C71_1695560 [compost metagenome]